MKNLFLNYELSFIAKEKGFDEPCLAGYLIADNGQFNLYGLDTNHQIPVRNSEDKSNLSAPLYQQIVDWFREKHNLEIRIILNAESGRRFPFIQDAATGGFDYECNNDWLIKDITYLSYYNALDKAIQQAFKLI